MNLHSKRFGIAWMIFGALLFNLLIGYAQTPVELAYNKTSSIVFPATITAVDRGSRDVLAQKVKGVENILQIKAGRVNFKETNLTVITADGKLHLFTLRYSDSPSSFFVTVPDEIGKDNRIPVIFPEEVTRTELEKYSKRILKSPSRRSIKSTSRYDMQLSLRKVYVSGNALFYHIRVANTSNLPFHTDMLRFYVRDKQKIKRTASQEVDQTPLFVLGDPSVVKGKSTLELVYALPVFTIPDAKILVIELMEKKGGRNLHLNIKHKVLLQAETVPSR